VNIYILNKIEEIFVYSMMMDMATTVKTKKEDNENNDSPPDKKKEEKFPSPAQYRNILNLIKQMIVQYQNRETKSKMNLFQNMLLEHKKDLHVFERKEATSIIYYILSFIDGKNKSSTEQIFTQFIQKSVDFINNTLILSSDLTCKRYKKAVIKNCKNILTRSSLFISSLSGGSSESHINSYNHFSSFTSTHKCLFFNFQAFKHT
jgi:hypothetical protein